MASTFNGSWPMRNRRQLRMSDALPTAAILARGHSQTCVHTLVNTAARSEAGFVDRIRDGILLAKVTFQRVHPARFDVLLRRHTDDFLECALQMKGA